MSLPVGAFHLNVQSTNVGIIDLPIIGIIIIIIYSSLRFRRIKYNAMYTYKGIRAKAYITN